MQFPYLMSLCPHLLQEMEARLRHGAQVKRHLPHPHSSERSQEHREHLAGHYNAMRMGVSYDEDGFSHASGVAVRLGFLWESERQREMEHSRG